MLSRERAARDQREAALAEAKRERGFSTAGSTCAVTQTGVVTYRRESGSCHRYGAGRQVRERAPGRVLSAATNAWIAQAVDWASELAAAREAKPPSMFRASRR